MEKTRVRVKRPFQIYVQDNLERFLDRFGDFVFYSETFEAIMDSFVVFAGMYFLVHIIVAWIKGWPL